MKQEICEQPKLLAENQGQYAENLSRAFSGKTYEMVLLAARGSSDQAALYLRYLIEIYLEIPVVLAAPSVWTHYDAKPKFRNCLAVGISQSGAGPDIAEVLSALQAEGHDTLAITNTPDSGITRHARQTLLLNAGHEKAVAATKSFSCSLLACYELARALGAPLKPPAIPDAAWLETCETAAAKNVEVLTTSNPVFCLARGIDFCVAMESSLKLMECALIAAKGYSKADFEHGPKALAGPGSAAIVYGDVSPALKENGCTLIPCPPIPCEEAISPLWEIFFGQWLALKAAQAKGLNPDQPRFLSKVTKTI